MYPNLSNMEGRLDVWTIIQIPYGEKVKQSTSAPVHIPLQPLTTMLRTGAAERGRTQRYTNVTKRASNHEVSVPSRERKSSDSSQSMHTLETFDQGKQPSDDGLRILRH